MMHSHFLGLFQGLNTIQGQPLALFGSCSVLANGSYCCCWVLSIMVEDQLEAGHGQPRFTCCF